MKIVVTEPWSDPLIQVSIFYGKLLVESDNHKQSQEGDAVILDRSQVVNLYIYLIAPYALLLFDIVAYFI